MNTAILQREPVVVDETAEEVDLMLGDLGWQSKEKLNYRRLHTESVTLKAKLSARQTLAELGIQPFTTASVRAYKSKCERKANGRLGSNLAGSAAISCLLALVSLPVLVGCALLGAQTAAFYAALLFAATTVLAIAGAMVAARLGIERQWILRPIARYSGSIPAFALQTALDVTDVCPEAKFYVNSLEQQQKVLDPFLVMRVGREDFYLEVWNEPGFGGKREA